MIYCTVDKKKKGKKINDLEAKNFNEADRYLRK